MESVIIVGGGISGLAVAERLSELNPLVLEREDLPGGHVRSEVEEGRIFDQGPNGWLSNEPTMNALIQRLGLTEQIVTASDAYGTRWIQAGGELHPVPTGLGDLLRSRLLAPGQKLRLLCEPLAPRGPANQSIGALMERRLGQGAVDRLVGPMVAGVYGGDPYGLSLAASFPLLASLESEHGGLLLGLAKGGAKGRTRGALHTLAGGSGQLTEILAKKLGDRVRCGVEVLAIQPDGSDWEVHTAEGTLRAHRVILACPAYAQARILREVDPALASLLAAIPYAPLTVVATVWPRDAFPRAPQGFGVLAARDEFMEGALGTVFASLVFPNQAHEDELLLRTMIGGSRYPQAAMDTREGLLRRTYSALEASLGPPRSSPRLTRIYPHPKGIPQYTVGHPARLATLDAHERRLPGLFLSGNHLRGIGVKDCVREADRLARRVIRYGAT